MHVISQSALRKFWEKYPDAETSLRSWYKLATTAERSNLARVKAVFSADRVGNFTVFNIRGNNYRLIAFIDYKSRPKKVFIRAVLTHQEYDEEGGKKDPRYQ